MGLVLILRGARTQAKDIAVAYDLNTKRVSTAVTCTNSLPASIPSWKWRTHSPIVRRAIDTTLAYIHDVDEGLAELYKAVPPRKSQITWIVFPEASRTLARPRPGVRYFC